MCLSSGGTTSDIYMRGGICVHTCILMDSFITLKRPSTHLRIPRRKLSFRTRLPQAYTLSCKSWPHKIQPVSITSFFSLASTFPSFLCFFATIHTRRPGLKRHMFCLHTYKGQAPVRDWFTSNCLISV